MSHGIEFVNDNDTAVISSGAIGYQFHSKQTYLDRFSDNSNLTGTIETYQVDTGDSTNPPLVFISGLGTTLESTDTNLTLADTTRLVAVDTISPVATGKWNVRIRRGYDARSSATLNLTILFFVTLPSYTTSGWGMVVRNSSGQPTYDSTKKMMMPRVFGAYGGTYNYNTIYFNSIANYSNIITALGITNPALMVSGNFADNDNGAYLDKCSIYSHTLYGLHSSGVIVCNPRVGHGVNDAQGYDACDISGSPSAVRPDDIGVITSAGALSFLIIDADDY